MFPQHLGEFNGEEALPKGDYPPVYSWRDRKNSNLRLSFNTPLLTGMCKEEARKANIEINDQLIKEVLNIFGDISINAFQTAMAKNQK